MGNKIWLNTRSIIPSLFLGLGLFGGVRKYAIIAYVLAYFKYVGRFAAIAYLFKICQRIANTYAMMLNPSQSARASNSNRYGAIRLPYVHLIRSMVASS